jgi:NAD(P)H-dependent FMN reductase
MPRILGISGSLRSRSINTSLLKAMAALAPAGTLIETATLHGIPLYDGDVEAADGIPRR